MIKQIDNENHRHSSKTTSNNWYYRRQKSWGDVYPIWKRNGYRIPKKNIDTDRRAELSKGVGKSNSWEDVKNMALNKKDIDA